MLKEALDAKLPLISVTSHDPLFAARILRLHTTRPVETIAGGDLAPPFDKIKSGTVYLRPYTSSVSWSDGNLTALYKRLGNIGSTVVVTNFPGSPPTMFTPCGDIGVPRELAGIVLSAYVDESSLEDCVASVSGLTLKQMVEAAATVKSTHKQITPALLQKHRQSLLGGTRGLSAVDTDLSGSVYLPPVVIDQWLLDEAPYFSHEDSTLRPRGLLFNGASGTGKTMAARYIAGSMGLPLYRVEVANIYGKYVGESEQAFAQVIAAVDKEEPCVVLFDEIEKLFHVDHQHSTSKSLLSELLWWLQERRTRVLTLMTTNNYTQIPPELCRPGRIDRIITFNPLSPIEAGKLCERLVKWYCKGKEIPEKELLTFFESINEWPPAERTYAAVSVSVKTALKKWGAL